MNSINVSPWSGRLLILAGILLSAFNLRTAVTSLTPILDTLGAHFGFGPAVMGVFGMVPTASFALFGVFTPVISRRLGLIPTALLSMLLAAIGLLLRAYALETWHLLAASAIALAGMGIGNVVLPPLVKRYFPLRIGAMSMSYITMLQMGTVMPALAAVPLTAHFGWPSALGVWSLTAAVAAAIWIVVLLQKNDVPKMQLRNISTEPAPKLQVWRSSLAWGLMFMFGMTSLISYAVFTWLPLFMIESGASPEYAGVLLGIFAGLGLFSGVFMPWAAERMPNPYALVLACVLAYAVAIPALLIAPMSYPVLWVVILGLGPSTFPLALTLINLRTKTATGSTALSGFAQGTGYLLSCAGPFLFGVLRALSDGWYLPFLFLSVCVMIMAIGAWFVCKPQFLEDNPRVFKA